MSNIMPDVRHTSVCRTLHFARLTDKLKHVEHYARAAQSFLLEDFLRHANPGNRAGPAGVKRQVSDYDQGLTKRVGVP
jgi:hypothetical protein